MSCFPESLESLLEFFSDRGSRVDRGLEGPNLSRPAHSFLVVFGRRDWPFLDDLFSGAC